MLSATVKSADNRDRGAGDHDDTRVRGANARFGGKTQRQDFAAGDATLVFHAWKLAQGKRSVSIQNRALGAHAAQRGAFAQQVAQILRGLLAALHGTAGLEHALKLQQGRSSRRVLLSRTQKSAFIVAQPQRSDTTEIVHSAQ